jgi:dethiobiotin synthetase
VPAVAAERAGTTLDPAAVEARMAALRAQGYTLVVEGAGGVLVPLAWGYTALDLAARTGLDAVVVARPGLGTLNHAALTVDALRARNIAVRGVVLNGRSTPPDLAEETNPDALSRLLGGVPVIVVPRLPTADVVRLARDVQPAVRRLL